MPPPIHLAASLFVWKSIFSLPHTLTDQEIQTFPNQVWRKEEQVVYIKLLLLGSNYKAASEIGADETFAQVARKGRRETWSAARRNNNQRQQQRLFHITRSNLIRPLYIDNFQKHPPPTLSFFCRIALNNKLAHHQRSAKNLPIVASGCSKNKKGLVYL